MITYDQFGCGQSNILEPERYTMDLFTEQLHDVIAKTVGNREVILAGISWGTMVISAYLKRYGSEGVAMAALFGPFFSIEYHNKLCRRRASELPEPYSSELLRCLDDDISGEEMVIATRPYMMEYYSYGLGETNAEFLFRIPSESYIQIWGHNELKCTGSAKDYDFTHALDGIDIPILFVMGERDIMEVSAIEEIASRIPDSKILVTKNRGHGGDEKVFERASEIIDEMISDDHISEPKSSMIENIILEPQGTELSVLREEGYRTILDPNNTLPTFSEMTLEVRKMDADECMHALNDAIGNNHSNRERGLLFSAMLSMMTDQYKLPSLNRRYSSEDPERHLIISNYGIESSCCEKASKCPFMDIKEWKKCPFCGCNAELVKPMIETKGKSYRELVAEFDKLKPRVSDVQDYIDLRCIGQAILNAFYKENENLLSKMNSMPDDSMTLGDVTGTLSHSTIRFESVCCDRFIKNYIRTTSSHGARECSVEFKDKGVIECLDECPYCGKKLMATPRSR